MKMKMTYSKSDLGDAYCSDFCMTFLSATLSLSMAFSRSAMEAA